MIKQARILTYIGCAVLMFTAVFHMSAWGQVTAVVNAPDTNPFVKDLLQPLWVFPSLHWFIIAIAGVLLARQTPQFSKQQSARFIGLLSLIPLFDAALVIKFTGPFIGGFMLLAAGLCWLFAAILQFKAK